MAPNKSPPIEGFDQLNDIISISRPTNTAPTTRSSNSSNSNSNSPSLIVYCSWMGAARKHIAKYIRGWRSQYPSATILLVESSMDAIFSSPNLTLANEAITAHLASHPPTERADGSEKTGIILAMSSNGGGLNGVRISNRLCHVHERAPFDAIIMDCNPGLPRVVEGTRAFTAIVASKPGSLTYTLAYWTILLVLYMIQFISVTVMGHEDVLIAMRRDLNSVSLFPRVTPRLYLYSKNDQMVRWTDVHEHAEEAREKRKYLRVREEVFQKAPHVALVTEDEERYWKAIRETVDAAK